MNDQAWMDQHYPRCVRCGLRTYVSTLTGRRCSEVTGVPGCPAWLEGPDLPAPVYPYVGSEHRIAAEVAT